MNTQVLHILIDIFDENKDKMIDSAELAKVLKPYLAPAELKKEDLKDTKYNEEVKNDLVKLVNEER